MSYSKIFGRLRSAIESGKIRLVGINSPIRVSGTSFLRALIESPSIDGYCYEPFRRPRSDIVTIEQSIEGFPFQSTANLKMILANLNRHSKKDPQRYKESKVVSRALERHLRLQEVSTTVKGDTPSRLYQGYEIITDIIEAHLSSQDKVVLAVKELSKNIPPGGPFSEWDSLMHRHIFLIRNPLLQLESLVRAESIGMSGRAELRDVDFDEYASAKSQNGFPSLSKKTNWDLFLKELFLQQNYRPLDDLFERFLSRSEHSFFDDEEKRYYLEAIGTNGVGPLNGKSLDIYARTKGYPNWQVLKEHALSEKDFAPVQLILQQSLRFRREGWSRLLYNFRRSSAPLVVDSTLFRIDPSSVLQKLCHELEVEYQPGMVDNWKNTFFAGHGDDLTHYNYKSGSSYSILPPVEEPVSLHNLPFPYQTYFSKAIKTYILLLKERLSHHSADEVECTIHKEVVEGSELVMVDPVFCACLILSSRDISPNMKNRMYEGVVSNAQPKYRQVLEQLPRVRDTFI